MTITAASPGAASPALPRLGPDEHVPVPGSMSFAKFMAGLNPLHHLPVVGTIYRAVTGETIQPAMRVLGGAVLGGPIGALSAAVMAAIDEVRAAPAQEPPRAAG